MLAGHLMRRFDSFVDRFRRHCIDQSTGYRLVWAKSTKSGAPRRAPSMIHIRAAAFVTRTRLPRATIRNVQHSAAATTAQQAG
jgi:hypothetical protein